MVVTLGVSLSTFDPAKPGVPSIPSAARHLEMLGFDAIWAGDHLSYHRPIMDSVVALSACAAVTERTRIGFAVLLPALRGPAWAAKQVSSLQVLSGNRATVGVGVGGEFAPEWHAAGVDRAARGATTDAFLAELPRLLGGRPAQLATRSGYLDIPPLRPHGGMPPVWIAGRSDRGLRRAARFGDTWLGLWQTSEQIPRIRARLAEHAEHYGRAAPDLAMTVLVSVDRRMENALTIAQQVVSKDYRMPFETVRRWISAGTAESVALELSRFVAEGVTSFVLLPLGADPLNRYDQLAEVASLLRRAL